MTPQVRTGGAMSSRTWGCGGEHHPLVAAVATGAEAAAFAGRGAVRGGHPMVPKLGPREAGKSVAEGGRRGRGKVPHVGAVVEEIGPRPNPNHDHLHDADVDAVAPGPEVPWHPTGIPQSNDGSDRSEVGAEQTQGVNFQELPNLDEHGMDPDGICMLRREGRGPDERAPRQSPGR
jgi:hypothetical protein